MKIFQVVIVSHSYVMKYLIGDGATAPHHEQRGAVRKSYTK